MGYLQNVHGMTLLKNMRIFEIRETLNIEPLLLQTEMSCLEVFGHAIGMLPKISEKQVLLATLTGK